LYGGRLISWKRPRVHFIKRDTSNSKVRYGVMPALGNCHLDNFLAMAATKRYMPRSFSRAPAYKRARYRVSTTKKRFQIKPYYRLPRRFGSLKTQVKTIRSALNRAAPEIKYVDVSQDQTNIPTTGIVGHVTAIAEGDTLSARDGQQIKLQSINIAGRFICATSVNASLGSAYRIALVVDKQQVADTAPSMADIFNGAGSPRPENLLPNLNNMSRFKYLWISEIFYPLMMITNTSGLTSAIVAAPTQGFAFEYNWSGSLAVGYNGANSTDIQKNGVYLCYISSDTQATIDIDCTVRVGFIDS